jgi:hypothetical protein
MDRSMARLEALTKTVGSLISLGQGNATATASLTEADPGSDHGDSVMEDPPDPPFHPPQSTRSESDAGEVQEPAEKEEFPPSLAEAIKAIYTYLPADQCPAQPAPTPKATSLFEMDIVRETEARPKLPQSPTIMKVAAEI